MKRLYVLLADHARLVVKLTVLAFAFSQMASAGLTNRYVVKTNSGALAPYDAWTNAAGDIQTVINYACTVAGETVLVAAATYDIGGVTNWPVGTVLTNRVAINKAITVRSANNDPTNTIIKGNWDPATNGPAAVRCVYMVDNSSLIGFMLTNGATLASGSDDDQRGGGLWCASATPSISNCVIAGNSAKTYGGGAYRGTLKNCILSGNRAFQGGGIYAGTINDCIISNNTVTYSGGGAMVCTLTNCTLTGNSAPLDGGGGVARGTLYNCILTNNSTTGDGGGASDGSKLTACTLVRNSSGGSGGGTTGSTLTNCTLINNYASGHGGGACYDTLYNCLLIGNQAGAYSGGAYMGTLHNCTVVGNYSSHDSGAGGTYNSTIINTVVYFNNALTAGNANWVGGSFANSCTLPDPGGTGNTTNDPMFIDKSSNYGTNHVAGNYRLSRGSPCINTGSNETWMTTSYDLDGRPRLDKISGIVDMGCYEYLPPITMFKVR